MNRFLTGGPARRAWLRGLSAVAFAGLVAGCDQSPLQPEVQTETEYQAVLLTNGHLFFGKLERVGTPYPILRDVYYVQSQVNPETKQVSNTLMKRGREWHGPSVMYLNAQHILLIESVGPESQVAQFIAQSKKQAPAAGAQK